LFFFGAAAASHPHMVVIFEAVVHSSYIF
jgi:hypothetical protein